MQTMRQGSVGAMISDIDRPEIIDASTTAEHHYCREELQSSPTSIDVLEISRTAVAGVQWHVGLDHEALLRRFGVRSKTSG